MVSSQCGSLGESRFRPIDVAVTAASSLFWCFFISSLVLPNLVLTDGMTRPYHGFLVMGAFVFGALVLLISGQRGKVALGFLDSRKSELMIVTAGVIGCLIAVGASVAGMLPAMFVAGALIGASAACSILVWATAYAHRGARGTCLMVCGGFAAALLLSAVICMLPDLTRVIVIAALPLVIVATLVVFDGLSTEEWQGVSQESPDGPTENSAEAAALGLSKVLIAEGGESLQELPAAQVFATEEKKFFGIPAVLGFSLLLAGLSLGSACYSLQDAIHQISVESLGSVIVSCALVLAVLFIIALVKPRFFSVAVQGCFAVACSALFVILTIGFENKAHLLLVISPVLVAILLVMVWMVLAELSCLKGFDAIAVFGIGLSELIWGVTAGYLLAWVLYATGLGSMAFNAVICLSECCMIYALFLMLSNCYPLWRAAEDRASCRPPSEVFVRMKREAEGAEQGAYDIASIAMAYGLTEREVDVLKYLFMGRSRPRIAQELCLSENTVSSHIQHIYRKVGVHSYQELLDCVL